MSEHVRHAWVAVSGGQEHDGMIRSCSRCRVVISRGPLPAGPCVPGPEERIESEAGRVLAEAAAPAPKALRHRWAPSTARHTHCERCGLLKGYPPDAVTGDPSWRMSWSLDGKTWTKGTKLPPCGERKTEAA